MRAVIASKHWLQKTRDRVEKDFFAHLRYYRRWLSDNPFLTMTTYDSDFYTWTQQQAALLKAGQFSAIDLANIIEEIETMGRSEKRELKSRLTVLLVRLLKWQCQPVKRGRSWQLTITIKRIQFMKVLRDNPSFEAMLYDVLPDAYELAVIKAAIATGLDTTSFPVSCPWSMAEITQQDFYPD